MYFTFQQSKLWEGGGDKFASDQKEHRIKARSEERARRKLPKPSMGREWLLVEKDVECPVCKGPAYIRFDQNKTVYCKDDSCSFMGEIPVA